MCTTITNFVKLQNEVWEADQLLLKCRAGTPAPNLLKDAKEIRGAGELEYPATASEARVGVDLADKPPFPEGKYEWTSYHAYGR